MRRAVFVPTTPESIWTDGVFPNRSPAELPVAGRLFCDYAMQVALRFNYRCCDVIDWSHSPSLAMHLASIDANIFSVAYRKGLGEMPWGLEEFEDYAASAGIPLGEDLTLVWGLHLTGHGREESRLAPVSRDEFRKTPTGIYTRERGRWMRLTPYGAAIKSPRTWLQANMAVLHDPDRFTLPGYSAESDVHLGRNVVLEHGTEVTQPVLICDNVWCARNVSIGGDVIIGSGSFVGEGTRLRNTYVCDNTYVGEGLDLTGKIVAGRRIIDPTTGAWTDAADGGVAREIERSAVYTKLRATWHFLLGKSHGRRG